MTEQPDTVLGAKHMHAAAGREAHAGMCDSMNARVYLLVLTRLAPTSQDMVATLSGQRLVVLSG